MMSRRSFTLIELLVVMGIIAVLAGVTALGFRGVAKDAKLASGKNTLMTALDNARALAIKNNRVVLVVFRARWDPNNSDQRQQTEIVLTQWNHESVREGAFVLDRFVPIPNVPVRTLPAGIKVAGPFYDFATGNPNFITDEVWITQTEFRARFASPMETPGRLFGILYSPNGDVITRNPLSDCDQIYVDFDNDRQEQGQYRRELQPSLPSIEPWDTNNFWEYDHPNDEVNVNPVPFLTVYDDDEARELKAGDWSVTANGVFIGELSDYITANAERIHFNRYTGVAMK